MDGGSDATNANSWPITNGEFDVAFALDAPPPGVAVTIRQGFSFNSNNGAFLQSIAITGRFDGTGQHATGTWMTTVAGSSPTSCPGTWQSS